MPAFGAQHHEWLTGFRRNLFGYACALSDDTASAEDLYQEAVLRAMSARDCPPQRAAFRAWMFRILRNLWVDRLRARRRLDELLSPESGEAPHAPGDDEDMVINRIDVRHAFARLHKAQRDVLALVDVGGFSYEETAELLDVPKGTVMSRISRARAALRRELLGQADSGAQVVALPRRRRP